MTRTQKIYGVRLGSKLPLLKDRFGRGNYRVIKFMYYKHVSKLFVLLSNGDVYEQTIIPIESAALFI